MESEYIDYVDHNDNKKKKKKFWIILIVSLFVLGGVGLSLGIYFVNKNKKPVDPSPTPEEIEKTRNTNIQNTLLLATDALLSEYEYTVKATNIVTLNYQNNELSYTFKADDAKYYTADIVLAGATTTVESLLTELGNKEPRKVLNAEEISFFQMQGQIVNDVKFDDTSITLNKCFSYHDTEEAGSEIHSSGIYTKNKETNMIHSYTWADVDSETHVINSKTGRFNEINKTDTPLYYSFINSLLA